MRQRQVLLLVLASLGLLVGVVVAFIRRPEPTAVAPTSTPAGSSAPTATARRAQATVAVAARGTAAPIGAAEPAAPVLAEATPLPPPDDFFDPQRFSYELNFNGPELQAYLETQPGPLKRVRFQVGNRSQSFTDVLIGMSSLLSFNPKIMLALLEQQSRMLSTAEPSPDQLALALGYSGEPGRRGLIGQLHWGATELRRAVRDYPTATTLTFADGKSQPYHASTFYRYAIARVLAQTTTPDQLDAKLNAFLDTYTRLFGDPRSVPVDWPSLAQPFLRWPLKQPVPITSFFDHDTPFLRANGSLVSYWGRTEQYLSYDGHTGWDLAAAPPEPALAAAAGAVIFAGNSDDGCGIAHAVILDHGNGYRTLYWHLYSLSVEAGQQVTVGQQVGVVGSSGCATGPHLHFQVQYLGRDVDPFGWCGGATPDPWAAYPGGQVSVWLWADWPSPCAPAPPDIIVVDNTSPGFASSGPWQTSPLGYNGGALLATSSLGGDSAPYALSPLESPAVAVWQPTLPRAGRYRVLAYVPYFLNGQEDSRAMNYHVRFSGGEADVLVDATVLANQWADLGKYEFDPTQHPQVSIGSSDDEGNRSVWADAVAWVPADQ